MIIEKIGIICAVITMICGVAICYLGSTIAGLLFISSGFITMVSTTRKNKNRK